MAYYNKKIVDILTVLVFNSSSVTYSQHYFDTSILVCQINRLDKCRDLMPTGLTLQVFLGAINRPEWIIQVLTTWCIFAFNCRSPKNAFLTLYPVTPSQDDHRIFRYSGWSKNSFFYNRIGSNWSVQSTFESNCDLSFDILLPNRNNIVNFFFFCHSLVAIITARVNHLIH